jgi:5-methylcytosine-specific restriction endonuclease McrA
MFQRTLEMHHRDSDKNNNHTDNLMTLCANCHREMGGLIFELDGDYNKAESLLKKFIKALLG